MTTDAQFQSSFLVDRHIPDHQGASGHQIMLDGANPTEAVRPTVIEKSPHHVDSARLILEVLDGLAKARSREAFYEIADAHPGVAPGLQRRVEEHAANHRTTVDKAALRARTNANDIRGVSEQIWHRQVRPLGEFAIRLTELLYGLEPAGLETGLALHRFEDRYFGLGSTNRRRALRAHLTRSLRQSHLRAS